MIPPLHRMRLLSFNSDAEKARFGKAYQGVHLSARPGTPVYAVADGICVRAQAADQGFYGRQIILKFTSDQGSTRGKTFYAFYAHLEKVLVRADPKQRLRAGTIIALTG